MHLIEAQPGGDDDDQAIDPGGQGSVTNTLSA